MPLRDLPTQQLALSRDNFIPAMLASCSIPFMLEGVPSIPGTTRPGAHWDGGLVDYHVHWPYASMSEGLVLYPHFQQQVVPGWLDKSLPWRRARGPWLDNVVLISPSHEYLERLPLKKLPDRGDFKRFVDDYDARLNYWRFAMNESERLAAEFIALSESEMLQSAIEPFG